jgi:hypothetical protein
LIISERYANISVGRGDKMALKLFKGKTEPQCAHCEYAEIADGSEVVVCRKIGGIMQLYSKCKKFKYDPLKREPRAILLSSDFSKEDFSL